MKGEAELDELDRQLVTALTTDPRMSYAALGERLGVAGMTVRTRLNRLRESGALRVIARPDPTWFGLTQVVGLIQADLAAVPVQLEILSASRYVMRVDRIVGEFDLAFIAAFPSHRELGSLVHHLQQDGVRRLVIQHVIGTPVDVDGWEAVFSAIEPASSAKVVVAPAVSVPRGLERDFSTAREWLTSYGAADVTKLAELCADDFVFHIKRPNAIAGTFTGIAELESLLERKVATYQPLENEIVRVAEQRGSRYQFTIDILGTVERRDGTVRNQFGRFAFDVGDGKVHAVASLAEMHLPDVVADEPD